jgi:hypothetical protein
VQRRLWVSSERCLINAVTGEVGPATKMSGNPTNQALACKQRAGDPNGCKILPVFEVKKKSVMKRLIARLAIPGLALAVFLHSSNNSILGQYLRDGIFYAKNPASIHRDTEQIKNLIDKPDNVDVIFANAGLTASGGHPVKLYDKILIKVKTPGTNGTFENLAYYIIDNQEDLERKWPLIMADHPDFIKTHLLYSAEFEKRRDDPAYYGDKGLDPKLLPLIVAKAHADGLRVACHIETAVDFRNALAAGVDEIAHLPGYYVVPAHPDWFPITEEDAALAARKGVDVVTTTYVSTEPVCKYSLQRDFAEGRENSGRVVDIRDMSRLIASCPGTPI